MVESMRVGLVVVSEELWSQWCSDPDSVADLFSHFVPMGFRHVHDGVLLKLASSLFDPVPAGAAVPQYDVQVRAAARGNVAISAIRRADSGLEFEDDSAERLAFLLARVRQLEAKLRKSRDARLGKQHR